jgi:nitrite reductase (NO-forming)
MKRNLIFGLVVLFATAILTSCGGSGSETSSAAKEETKKEETPAPAPAKTSGLEAQLEMGKKIYDTKCVVCHQVDAKGIEGAFPPLANADYLLADPVRGVRQTLNGSHEEMVINGVTYNAPMPPQVETKEEALAVINYVLKKFNGYSEDQLLTMEDIKDVEINTMKQ